MTFKKSSRATRVGVLRIITRQNNNVNDGLYQTLQDLKKLRFQKWRVKTLSNLFSITNKLFIKSSRGTTLDSTYYKNVFELLKSMAHVHLEKFRRRDCFILHDDTLAQNTTINQRVRSGW